MTIAVTELGTDEVTGTEFIEDVRGALHFPGAGSGYSTIINGELAGSAVALQMPDLSCKLVKFKAAASNAGNVYIGGAGVTAPDGTTDVTTGLELTPRQETGWLPVSNLNLFYRICDNAGDDLNYLAMV